MEPRKIIKFGNSSYVVTLPQEWMDKNNLEKGDVINVCENKGALFITSPKELEKSIKKATINLDDKPLKLFNKELLSYYLKNYKTIEITGEDVYSRLDQIKIFKEKLSSIEITKVSKNSIVLSDLSAPSSLKLKNLLCEIIEMEEVIFDELSKTDAKKTHDLVNELDKNINKLSFLAYKAINYNLDTWEHPQELKNAIHNWRIISTLENIGDISKRIARYLKNETDKHSTYVSVTIANVKDYFKFVTSLVLDVNNIDESLKLYLDKKQSILKEIEMLRDKLYDDLNLFLVISQLLKDIIGDLDTVILSIIDIKN